VAVEIYSHVGGEQLERLIARHIDVQQDMAVRATRAHKTARRVLEQSESRRNTREAREHRETHPFKSRTYQTKADIDHHVGIEGYTASRGGANKTIYEVLQRALRRF